MLGFKEHLDWLKIDFNAAKIITVQNYNNNKKNNVNGSIYIVLKLRVKQVIFSRGFHVQESTVGVA